MRTAIVLRGIARQRSIQLLTIVAFAVSVASCDRAGDVHERQIVFESERDGQWEIYVMNLDGSNQKRLTHSQQKDVQNRLPNWCGPGSKIIFVSDRDRAERGPLVSGAARWDLYVMNADGSDVRRLTHFRTGGASFPACSPDGSRISFVSTHEGPQELYLMDVDGSGIRRLTENGGNEELSDWSPDGRTIAFDASQGDVFDVYLIGPDGSGLRRLTRTVGKQGSGNPDWSPNGSRLVFHSDREGKSELYVMDGTGSNIRRLTHTPVNAVSRQARWSLDSKQIIFVSDRDGNWQTNREIYVMNADGSQIRRLTFNDARDNHPDW